VSVEWIILAQNQDPHGLKWKEEEQMGE